MILGGVGPGSLEAAPGRPFSPHVSAPQRADMCPQLPPHTLRAQEHLSPSVFPPPPKSLSRPPRTAFLQNKTRLGVCCPSDTFKPRVHAWARAPLASDRGQMLADRRGPFTGVAEPRSGFLVRGSCSLGGGPGSLPPSFHPHCLAWRRWPLGGCVSGAPVP